MCAQGLIFCLSNKLKKWDLKQFLVTDIISMITQFRVRTIYDEFQSSTDLLRHTEKFCSWLEYSHTCPTPSTVQFHLSRLIGMAIHLDEQKIRIIGFFFENRLHWQFELEKISSNSYLRLHIYLCTNNTFIHNSLYVFDNWRKNFSQKKKM